MTTTLEKLAIDIRAALKADPGASGKQAICLLVEKVLHDQAFIAAHLLSLAAVEMGAKS